MIMMIPMMIILVRFFGFQIRNWILLISILCGLTFFYELTYDPDILLRIVMIVFSLSGLSLFLWMYIRKPLSEVFSKRFIYRLLRAMSLISSILLFVSVIANLLGAFSLAEFFTILPIQIVLLAIGFEVALIVTDTMIYLILASNYMQRANVIKSDFQYIYRKTVRL